MGGALIGIGLRSQNIFKEAKTPLGRSRMSKPGPVRNALPISAFAARIAAAKFFQCGKSSLAATRGSRTYVAS
jgi:hypothetical protein